MASLPEGVLLRIANRFRSELVLKAPVDTGRLRSSINVTTKGNTIIVTMVDYACVLGGKTNITTDKGSKLMCNIREGDMVLTQDGTYQKVIKTISYPAKQSPNMIEVETEYRKDRNHKLKLTQDHKVLVFKNNCFFWKEAGKLDYDDMLMTRIKNNKYLYFKKDEEKHELIECLNCSKLFDVYKKSKKRKYCSYKCRYEHWRNGNNPHIGLKRSLESRKKMSESAIKKFKEKPELHPNRIMNKKGYQTDVEKQVEKWLKSKNVLYKKQFKIGGYFADFYIPESNEVIECDGAYWHKDQNKDIERDKKLLKIIPNLKILHLHFTDKRFSKIINNAPIKNVKYVQVNPSMESYCCLETFKPVKIKKLRKFVYPKQNNGNLYDLSVENVHSYYANGILVSNCFVEFGTNRQRPNPFIRNTIQTKLHNIVATEISKYYNN